MKGKSVWKRMMAMLLSLAMILTSTGFATLDAKGSWYDPTQADESDGVAFGLIFRKVWKEGNGNWNRNEDFGEYRDREYLPGSMYEIFYKATPEAEPVPVSADDIQITFYTDEDAIIPEWEDHADPRFFLAENAQGVSVNAVPVEDSIIELRPTGSGWCVLSLKDLQAYDPDFQPVSDNSVDWNYEKTLSGNYSNWNGFMKDTEVMATMRFVYPGAGFYELSGNDYRLLDNGYNKTFDFSAENPGDELYVKIDENEWEAYSDTTDVFDENAGENANKPNPYNDGQLVVEEDGYRTFGELKNGASVGDYFTVEAQDEPGVYKLVFDPNTRHRDFSIKLNYRNKDKTNGEGREEYNIQMHNITKPYDHLFVSWVDWYDGYKGKEGPMFMDGSGAPAQFIRDEHGKVVDNEVFMEPKKLENRMGMDFTGADIWVGYGGEDPFNSQYIPMTVPADLKVDFYGNVDDFYNGKGPDASGVREAFSQIDEANMIHFYPVCGMGYYVITCVQDPTVYALIDVGNPGMGIYKTNESTQDNWIEANRVPLKLISGNDATYDFGIFENYWGRKEGETEDRNVYLDINRVEIKTYYGGDCESALFGFDKDTCELNKIDGVDIDPSDYISLVRTAAFNDDADNWYKLTLKAPGECSYDIRFFIDRPEGGSSEFCIRANVMQNNQINVYSDQFEHPEESVYHDYCFRAINPITLPLRFMRMKLVNGKAEEVPFTDEELKTFKLYSAYKVEKHDQGDYEDRWMNDEPEEVDPQYGSIKVLGNGWLEVSLMQQSERWILDSRDLDYGFQFKNCEPGIGFFNSTPRPDIKYGMDEVLTEWLGDEETVYEIPGKKTTKPQAKYLWVWSNPSEGYSAEPSGTQLSVKGYESTDGFVIQKGELEKHKNYENDERMNYSGFSVDLTDQASKDYTLVASINKFGNNYRWIGDMTVFSEDYDRWEADNNFEEIDGWYNTFALEGADRTKGKLVAAVSAAPKYVPTENGTAMEEIENTANVTNLYILWNKLKQDELNEQYEYTVHVEKFNSIKVVNQPSKTSYTEGDTFNKAGLKVMAYYEDAAVSPVDVTAYVKVPATALKTSDKSVMITYEGMGGTLSTSVAVNVTAKQITPATPAVNPTPEGKEVEVASGGSTNSEYKVTESGSSSESGAVVYEGEKTDTATNVTIPDTIKGKDGVVYKVTEIADGAMKGNAKVTNVTIGANVEVIGAGAFEGASNLKSVTAGANVTTIKKNAFNKCAKMTSFKAKGSKITTIGDGAFQGTKKMKTADFSKQKLKKIGKNAFSGSGVTKIKINANTLKTVGKGALKNAGNKKKVTVTVYAKSKKIADKAIKKLKKGKGSSKITFKFKKKK